MVRAERGGLDARQWLRDVDWFGFRHADRCNTNSTEHSP